MRGGPRLEGTKQMHGRARLWQMLMSRYMGHFNQSEGRTCFQMTWQSVNSNRSVVVRDSNQ